MRNVSANTRKLTTLAMLAALAIVLVALIHFPLVPAAPFLEYDPADIPIFIGTFLFGPAAGLALTAVVCVIQGVTVSAASGPIGIIMHFLATGTFVLLAGNLYRAHRTRKAALLGLTRHWAAELGEHDVTVNGLAPGRISTPLLKSVPKEINDAVADVTALRRLGTPEEVADACLFFASDQARFVTGQVLDVAGGWLMT